LLLLALLSVQPIAQAETKIEMPAGPENGLALMTASLLRHAPAAHVYEEQALLMTDRQGKVTLRTLRSYTLA
jgi:hypothetical protein